VIPKELIKDQGVLTLRQILSNVPGITFGAGEGGSGFGDKINIRGYAADNDISIDGIRDSAQTTRTDPFDVEQIEVFKGASSVNSGAGAVGGSINLVSKTPEAETFRRLSGGVGTENYGRFTADINQMINETTAVRINGMVHEQTFAERNVTRAERWGFAPSVKFGLGQQTQWTLAYFHQYDNNIPDFGVPFRNYKPVPGVSRRNYYGFSNVDSQIIKNDALTSIFEREFNSHVKLRNATRFAANNTDTTTDGVEGDVCINASGPPLGQTAATGAVPDCSTAGAGSYTPRTGPNGQIRNTTNKILVNQTDVTWAFNTGLVAHTMVTGAQISKETYHLDSGALFRNANGSFYTFSQSSGTKSPYPTTSLYNPNNLWTLPMNAIINSYTDTDVNNSAIYVFDTAKFGDHWILSGGVRYERNRTNAFTFTRSPNPSITGTGTSAPSNAPGPFALLANNPISTDDKLLSYRVGLSYKPVESGTIYVSYGNSKLPAASSGNTLGNCTNTTTSTTVGSNTCVKPETTVAYEVGAKWDVLQERLSLTAAVFRNDRTNYRVASGDASVAYQQLDGESRVDGIELGAQGQITKEWAIYANYAYLRSEVLRSIAKNSPSSTPDPQKGNALGNVPANSGSLWTTYELPIGLQLGYGLNYSSTVYMNSTTKNKLPGYTVQNALLGYKWDKDLSFALNINNLTNRVYYTQLRGVSAASSWANPGEGRNAVLTANYNF
ncbi:MAG: TonB-dependent siderophore receptor, partial [Rhizobium sp.]